jgi:putative phosphoribosyl transferase
MARFADRARAGRALAGRLDDLRLQSPLVLGLPRGGVPVAAEVAAGLDVPFNVLVARKVGAPGQEELGIGAVAEGRDEPVMTSTATALGLGPAEVDALVRRARREVARRVELYRAGRDLPEMREAEVVLVDDGLATGSTAEAALRAVRERRPRRLVLAVPVGARQAVALLAEVADEVVCVREPSYFVAVGEWYEDFSQVTDDEVLRLLENPANRNSADDRPPGQ